MARIASATTTVVNAYLTDLGRQTLLGFNQYGASNRFNNQGQDLFLITDFSLYDTDVNYATSNKLESGDVPDISGTGTNHCLKTFGNSIISGKKRLYY